MLDQATKLGGQIGRYFSIASVLPAAVFLLWLVTLAGASAPWQSPDLESVATAVTTWSVAKAAGLATGAVLLGLVVHPLLFATTQMLEGYWGHGRLGFAATVLRADAHRSRLNELMTRADELADHLRGYTDRVLLSRNWTPEELAAADAASALDGPRRSVLGSRDGLPVVHLYLEQQAIARSMSRYPVAGHRVMPTRLGNVLRRIEDTTGAQYGLDLLLIAPQLTVVAAAERREYISDSRQAMDVSIRICFFSLLAAVITMLWLAPTGWWVMAAVAPYVLAYVMYRGAVASAEEWGAALAAAVQLDRFAMYEAMRLELPKDSDAELAVNEQLMAALRGQRPTVAIRYDVKRD